MCMSLSEKLADIEQELKGLLDKLESFESKIDEIRKMVTNPIRKKVVLLPKKIIAGVGKSRHRTFKSASV